MARMSIDDKFLRDGRVKLLGQRMGWSRRETMGALLDVFAISYDREDDVLPDAEIDAAADKQGFAEAMIEVGLGERDCQHVRIRGAAERIEYLAKKREAGAKGGRKSGESRRNRNEAKRSSASEAREAFGNPPDPVPDLPPDPVPDQIPDLSHRAHAIPPVPEQQVAHVPTATPGKTETGPNRPVHETRVDETHRDHKPANVIQTAGYNPDDPRARGRLAEATYRRVSDARLEVARKLGLPEPLPFPVISPGRHPLCLTDLQDRIREEGPLAPVVCDRIVANLTAQAVETRSLEWLAEKFSAAGPWRTAKDWTPEAQRPRAGPFGSAVRAPEQPRKITTLNSKTRSTT